MNVSNRTPSVFCAVSHGLYKPWLDILYSGQVPTWLSNKSLRDFSVHHFHGLPGNTIVTKIDKMHEKIRWSNRWVAAPLRILDNILSFPVQNYIPSQEVSKNLIMKQSVIQINFIDTYVTMKWKDLAIFDYFIRKSEDSYLFMTTTSSYIRPIKLQEIISHLPISGVYAGALSYPGAKFASGNNRLFSRDVILEILSLRKNLESGLIHDMALGNLCSKIGLTQIELPKRDILSMEELYSLSEKDLISNFHFRLKSGTLEDRNDVAIMNELHRRVRVIDDV